MDNFDYSAIGQRIKVLRKRKGLNQTELATMLDKSLRTIQKYENGEIEVSIAVVNQLAELLDSTPTYILGYETKSAPIKNLADVMSFLFQLEQVTGIQFSVDVKKPPRNKDWQCSISFNGKSTDVDYNADMCLFLEQWEEQREDLRAYSMTQKAYNKWKDQTLAYYAAIPVECVEPEELSEEDRIEKHNAYLQSLYGAKKGEV